jgi:hypothetical protein
LGAPGNQEQEHPQISQIPPIGILSNLRHRRNPRISAFNTSVTSVLSGRLLAFDLLLDESITADHRLRGVFRESMIGFGFLTKQKPRALAGDDFPGE